MTDILERPALASASAAAPTAVVGEVVPLSGLRVGDRGVIVDVRAEAAPDAHGVDVHELQRRLLEFGFVEGAEIEVLHEGAIRRDPLALRVDDMRVALRRRDAQDVYLRLTSRATRGRR